MSNRTPPRGALVGKLHDLFVNHSFFLPPINSNRYNDFLTVVISLRKPWWCSVILITLCRLTSSNFTFCFDGWFSCMRGMGFFSPRLFTELLRKPHFINGDRLSRKSQLAQRRFCSTPLPAVFKITPKWYTRGIYREQPALALGPWLTLSCLTEIPGVQDMRYARQKARLAPTCTLLNGPQERRGWWYLSSAPPASCLPRQWASGRGELSASSPSLPPPQSFTWW